MKVGDLVLDLVIDGKSAQATIRNFGDKLESVDGKSRNASRSLVNGFRGAKIAILGAAAAIGTAAVGVNKMIQKASQYQEANSKMLTVFKDIQGEARKMRDELVSSYDMSIIKATELLGATGDILTGFGIQQEEAANLSFEVQKLSADIASFTNAQGGAEAVSQALTKAMLGERESLKTYGVAIVESDVQQRLFEKGQHKLTGAALRQAKAQVTLELAMEQSKNAVGDLARTHDSFANTQRRVGTMIENIALKFGAVFLPIAHKVLTWFEGILKKAPIDKFAGYIGAVLQIVKEFVTRLWNYWKNLGEMFANLFTLNFDGVKESADKLWSALADGWGETFDNIVNSYSETQEAVDRFLEGDVNSHAMAQQQKIKAEEEKVAKSKELIKQEQEARQALYDFEMGLKQQVSEYEQSQHEGSLEREQARVDYMYESGRISHQDYMMVMADRIRHAKIIHGKESVEYMKLVDQKAKMDKDYEKMKMKQQMKSMEQYSGQMSHLLGAAKGTSKTMFAIWKASAIAQAIINTLTSATKSMMQYGWPLGLPMAAAALAFGYAKVSQIRAQKFKATGYAKGGLVTDPTLSFIGEAGQAEVIAPKRDFIQVVNNMVRSGEIKPQGGQSNAVLIGRIDRLESAIRESRTTSIEVDGIEIARAVEQGDARMRTGEISY